MQGCLDGLVSGMSSRLESRKGLGALHPRFLWLEPPLLIKLCDHFGAHLKNGGASQCDIKSIFSVHADRLLNVDASLRFKG